MAKLNADDKRLFVVASGHAPTCEFITQLIQKHINNAVVFNATDGFDAIFKMENAPPHVLIVDSDIAKLSPIELTTKILAHPKLTDTSILLLTPIPEKEEFVDQVVTGQVQYLTDFSNEVSLSACLTKALNRLVDNRNFSYRLRFLAPSEILFHENDKAESVFIVRRGELQAYKGKNEDQKILGKIMTGEFVGEMAHINSEPRSATVKALTDCELIEIPMGTLDTILFSKPAWSKALVSTLSKRLKRTNESL